MEYISRGLIISVLLVLILTTGTQGVVCPDCGKNFKVLNRHTWRCQSWATASEVPLKPLPPSASADNNTSDYQLGNPPSGIPARRAGQCGRPKRVVQSALGIGNGSGILHQEIPTTTTNNNSSATTNAPNTRDRPCVPPSPTSPLPHDPDPVMCHRGRWRKGLRGLRANLGDSRSLRHSPRH